MPRLSVRRALMRVAAPIHFWLSLVVGLQALAWTVSGLFMSAVPIERVRSEHRLSAPPRDDLPDPGALLHIDAAFRAANTPLTRLSLERVGGRAVYVGDTHTGGRLMLDARTGARLSPISADFARRIAADAITGAAPAQVDWIADRPPIEYRGELPVWRVSFDDGDKLAVYIAPDTGQILARRSDVWRLYDFLWSLHIMDYRGRDNFNHAPLILFASGAVVMSLAGLVLLVLRAPQRMPKRRQTLRSGSAEPDDDRRS